MTQCVVLSNRPSISHPKNKEFTPKSPNSNQNSKTPLWFSLRISQQPKAPSTPHQHMLFSTPTRQTLLEHHFLPSTKFRYFPSLSPPFTFDLFTRNRLYREKYRGFESHRLRHLQMIEKILCPQKAE